MNLKARVSLVVATSLLAAFVSVVPAQAASRAPERTMSESAHSEQAYTPTDIVGFFILGTGKIYTQHRKLAGDLGIEHQPGKEKEASEITAALTKSNPKFDAEVVAPIQSGNPIAVEGAMKALDSSLKNLEPKASNASEVGTGNGNGYLYDNVAVDTNLVVGNNVAFYNAAGIFVGVAAVALAVAAAVSGPNSSEFGEQEAAAEIAREI